MNLPDEALDAAIEAQLAHGDEIYLNRFLCRCGETFLAAGVSHVIAAELHSRHRMQAVADALVPYIRAQILREEGHQEWRVSGDPGPEFGPYNFTWPRPGWVEDGEEQARALYNLITDGNHVPWVDGPYLHCRTVYNDASPWLPAEENP